MHGRKSEERAEGLCLGGKDFFLFLPMLESENLNEIIGIVAWRFFSFRDGVFVEGVSEERRVCFQRCSSPNLRRSCSKCDERLRLLG